MLLLREPILARLLYIRSRIMLVGTSDCLLSLILRSPGVGECCQIQIPRFCIESYYVSVCRVGLGMGLGGATVTVFVKLPGNSVIVQVGNPSLDSNLMARKPSKMGRRGRGTVR